MKPGRNDPCPCGSGKKYKHCCLSKTIEPAPLEDLVWRRLRRALEPLRATLLRFATDRYGAGVISEAWSRFVLWDEQDNGFDPHTPHIELFMPWFFDAWAPDPKDTSVTDTALVGVPPVRAFLDTGRGRNLDRLVKAYLQSCLEQPFSFFEVQAVSPGRSLSLQDVLTGARREVLEGTASRTLRAGDLVFGQLASAGGVTLLEANGAIVLPPSSKVQVVALRGRICGAQASVPSETYVSVERVQEWEGEIRELYWNLVKALMNRQTPQLRTPEGDALEFHHLVYDIDSWQEAVQALQPYSAQADANLISGAKAVPDASAAAPAVVELDLARPGQDVHADSVSLAGHVRIQARKLTIDVASRERAAWVRNTLVPQAFGRPMVPRADSIQTVEQAMRGGANQPSSVPEVNDLEAREAMIATLRAHYDEWIDTPLPALARQTPRHAVRSPDGREQVAALIDGAERTGLGLSVAERRALFDAIRTQLGLPPGGQVPDPVRLS